MRTDRLYKCIKSYLNPFECEPVRYYKESTRPSTIYRKRGYLTATTSATGSIALRMIGTNSKVQIGYDNTSPVHDHTANIYTYTDVITMTELGQNLQVVQLGMRIKYIGPLKDRGGVCYSISGVTSTQYAY